MAEAVGNRDSGGVKEGLSARQRRYCEMVAEGMPRGEARLAAGYARRRGHRVEAELKTPEVAAYLEELLAGSRQRAIVDRREILMHLTKAMRAQLAVVDDGDPSIQETVVEEIVHANGTEVTRVRHRLMNKLRAVRQLVRMQTKWKQRGGLNEASGVSGVSRDDAAIPVSMDQLLLEVIEASDAANGARESDQPDGGGEEEPEEWSDEEEPKPAPGGAEPMTRVRQRSFCEYVARGMNLTSAYQKAGYRVSKEAAARGGLKLMTLPKVAAYIEALQDEPTGPEVAELDECLAFLSRAVRTPASKLADDDPLVQELWLQTRVLKDGTTIKRRQVKAVCKAGALLILEKALGLGDPEEDEELLGYEADPEFGFEALFAEWAGGTLPTEEDRAAMGEDCAG